MAKVDIDTDYVRTRFIKSDSRGEYEVPDELLKRCKVVEKAYADVQAKLSAIIEAQREAAAKTRSQQAEDQVEAMVRELLK